MGRLIKTKNVKLVVDEGETSTIDVHQGHHGDRILMLSAEVKELTVATIISQMIALDNQDPTKPIQLIINTLGGSIDEMFALYDTIKFVRSPIHTLGLGKIMSAGTLILACGEKGKRLISPNSRLMFHAISGGAVGNIFDVLNEIDEMKRQQEQLNKCIIAETKMSRKMFEQVLMLPKDIYMTPEMAIKFGFADRVVPSKSM